MASITTPLTRWKRIVPIVSLASLLSSCMFLNPNQDTTLRALNGDRAAHGLGTLWAQPDAEAKAQAWAEQLARDGYLHHSSLPSGINTRWCSLGENIGYGPSITAIETAYMNSPTHRDNILASKWNGAGVGVATAGGRVYTVQEFITTC